MQSDDPEDFLLPVETVLDDIPALALTDEEISRVRQGQSMRFIARQDIDRFDVAGINETTDMVLAIGNDKPIALLRKDGVTLHPVRLFNL